MRRIWCAVCCLTSLLPWIFFPAQAKELPALAPFTFSAHYGFYWNGLPFGVLDIKAEEKEKIQRMEATIRSTGLAALFAPHKSTTTLEVANGKTIYETNYTTRDEPRRVKITYSPMGTVSETIVEPPEDPVRRPPPSAEQLKQSLDPLSFVIAARQALHHTLAADKTEFSLSVFDGRRLMETPFTVQGEELLRRPEGKLPVVHCLVQRKPIAGYTEKELKSLKKDNPALHILFSNDEKMLPLKLYVDVLGRMYAVLEKP